MSRTSDGKRDGSRAGTADGAAIGDKVLDHETAFIRVDPVQVLSYCDRLLLLSDGARDSARAIRTLPYFSGYQMPSYPFYSRTARRHLSNARRMLRVNAGRTSRLMEQYIALEASYPGNGVPRLVVENLFASGIPKNPAARARMVSDALSAAREFEAKVPRRDKSGPQTGLEGVKAVEDRYRQIVNGYRTTLGAARLWDRAAVTSLNKLLTGADGADEAIALLKSRYGFSAVQAAEVYNKFGVYRAAMRGPTAWGFENLEQVMLALGGSGAPPSLSQWAKLRSPSVVRGTDMSVSELRAAFKTLRPAERKALLHAGVSLSEMLPKTPGRAAISGTRFMAKIAPVLEVGGVVVDIALVPYNVQEIMNNPDMVAKLGAGVGIVSAVAGGTLLLAGTGLLGAGAAATATGIGAPVGIGLAVVGAGVAFWATHRQAAYDKAYAKAYKAAAQKAFLTTIETEMDSHFNDALTNALESSVARSTTPTRATPFGPPFGRSAINVTTRSAA